MEVVSSGIEFDDVSEGGGMGTGVGWEMDL